MDLPYLAKYAEIKGINIVGTGDILHPKWFSELKTSLVLYDDGIYIPKNTQYSTLFILSVEINLIFKVDEKNKHIHHVLLMPNFDVADQMRTIFSKYGNLDIDGRPDVHLSPPELIDLVKSVSKDIFIFPAHIFTPWYSLFGAFSGFDSLEECYQDRVNEIKAIETGLSSDPPMNYRLSQLDNLLLLSNSDSHSPYPWRLGREANIFELEKINYKSILDALRMGSRNKLIGTIEVPPELGKYHWTGHRRCNVSYPPDIAIKMKDTCPVCRRRMTIGVSERVELLADRPKPQFDGKPTFHYLLPFHEILSRLYNIGSFYSKKLWSLYYKFVQPFGTELNLLLFAPEKKLKENLPVELFEVIINMRKNRINISPGYDGVYGILNLNISHLKNHIATENSREAKSEVLKYKQTQLEDYF